MKARIWMLALMCSTAWGTTVPGMSFDKLLEQSSRVVHGKVREASVRLSGQIPWTHYTVEVLDCIKGSHLQTITVSEPGGTVDGVTTYVDGAVRFQPGEEVVLLLSRMPNGFWRTTGWSQGKIEVLNSHSGKRIFGTALAPAPRGKPSLVQARNPGACQGQALSDFLQFLRRRIGARQ